MNIESLLQKCARLRRLLAIVLITSLFLGSCAPQTPRPPAATTPPSSSVAPPTETPTGLLAIDDGAPLPPRVIERIPPGAQELPVDGEIKLIFDQAMQPERTAAAWQVKTQEGEEVAGKLSWDDARTLVFKPTTRLQSGSLYYASLGTQAATQAGVSLLEAYDFQFITTGDLQVSQAFPADGAKDIEPGALITAIFNRPVAPLVITEEKDTLPQPLQISPEVEGVGEWVSTSVYAFRPARGLQNGTRYQVKIAAGLQDALGESSLAQDYSWSFNTAEAGIDALETSRGIVNPPNNADKVLLDETFKIRFLQPMQPASAEAALSLTSAAGEKVGLETSWNTASTQVVITPTQRLALGTSYTLALGREAQAANGGMLKDGLEWRFTTIPPPAILSTRPLDGERLDYFSSDLFIQFASPMRIDTVKERIQITPRPEGEIEWWYNDWDWSLVGFMLQPSTRYEVRFLPGMEDIYGNKTSAEKVIHFTTAARPPEANLAMPYEMSVMRASGPPEAQEFYISYRNVKQVRVSLYSLSVQQVVDFQTGRASQYNYNPPADSLVWETTEISRAGLNERIFKKLRPSLSDGKPLQPGLYYLGLESPEVTYGDGRFDDFRLLMVASANLTLKTTSTQALAWLTDLESGKPVTGADIRIYDDKFKEISQGVTNVDGLLKLKLPEPDDPYQARFAASQDEGKFAYVSSQWGSGANLYDYGIWTSYYGPTNQPTAYIYTERPIYRPGQPVFFKGIVRQDNDLDYRLPSASKIKVRITNYQETIFEEELPLSAFGSFAGKITLDNEAALGYYTIEAYGPTKNGEAIIGSVSFNVAEYRRPEYLVKVSVEPGDVLVGDDFTAQVQADYFSGGGVADAEVAWTLVAEPFSYTPPDEYSGYSFNDREEDVFWTESIDTSSEVVGEGSGQTDARGRFRVTLPATPGKATGSQTLTFEATVTDVSQNAVSGREQVIVHLSKVYPGIQPASYIGKANETQRFNLVALDWNGAPLAKQELNIEIVERRWYSVQEQDAAGRVEWKSTVEDIPITLVEATTDEKGEAQASFTPPNGGVYRARVTAQDERGNVGKASTYLWVASDEYIPWRQTNDRSFNLIADRKSYKPGDTAELLIASPFQGDVYALVTVERGLIRTEEVILLQNNSVIYPLPITPDMAPNIYVSVILIKGVDETNPRPNFKINVVELNVDRQAQQLNVQLSVEPKQAGPRELVVYSVRVSDAQGKPVSAEVSLGLSDLATLSLMPPNSPPLLQHFYSERSLGVWTSLPLVMSLDEYNAELDKAEATGAAMGSGGAKGEGDLGVVEVRQDFPDTALWEAQVVTDARGQASIGVTLPDNLTTWRMDARAVTADTRVGQATLDLVSTKPLLVRPQTPRFFVAKDQARLGAAINNNSDTDLEVKVSLEAEGVALQDPAQQTIQVAARRQAYVSWQVTVNPEAERVDLVFRAEGGGYSDASRPTLATLEGNGIPVYRYEAHETVGTSGMMTENGVRVEAISLPRSMAVSDGELTIRVSPSLAAGLTDGLTYLEHFEYECVEQTISRFLPNVITTQALKSAGLSDPALEASLKEQVGVALQRLYKWQNPDGGWGWWGLKRSDPLTSAYVVMGLVEAQSAGYTVSKEVAARGLDYLRTQISDMNRATDPVKMNRQAFILYVLAKAGQADVSSAVQLYEMQRQRLALFGRAFLAETFYIINQADQRVQTLQSDFNNAAITSATGTHWEEANIDRENWNTDTRTTAIILSVLSQVDPGNPLNANAVRWLMSNRSNGHWLSTQETAWSLMALTRWMSASGELQADYEFGVALNGEQLGGGSANRETLRQNVTLKVQVTDLLKDEANRLAFARQGGAGNLYYTAHLDVQLPAAEVKALNQGIIVSRSYTRLDNPDTPVTQVKQGELLAVRVTVVAPSALHYVVIDDPLPAGLEAVDQSLETSQQNVNPPPAFSWKDMQRRGWGWWFFDRIQLRDEKAVLSANYLPAGTYVFTYLARASSVGQFQVIPPTAQEFYFPEVYGRGEGSLFTVTP